MREVKMSGNSLFKDEDNIRFKDKELKEFCESHGGNSNGAIDGVNTPATYTRGEDRWDYFLQDEILNWYKNHRLFSFAMFHNWKLQGYWFADCLKCVKVLELFMDDVDKDLMYPSEDSGQANFVYEEGQPFYFRLNYLDKKIKIFHTPIVWDEVETHVVVRSQKLREDMEAIKFSNDI